MVGRSTGLRLSLLVALSAGCSGASPGSPDVAVRVAAPIPPPAVAPAVARRGRTPIAEAPEIALETAILPVQGGASALFVSQFAGERAAWARRIDGATGALGPVLELPGEHVFGAFDAGDGRFTLVTSSGAELCIATYAAASDRPEGRGCGPYSPAAIAPAGDRLALLELAPFPIPPSKSGASARPAPARPKPKPAAPPRRAGAPKKPGDHAPAKKPGKHVASSHRPPPKIPVDVKIRWATRAGVIDAEASPTGLHFEQPLDGMALVDARARPPGIDLLWYESAPSRKTRSPLGSGRLMAGSLRADGTLDFKSRVAVLDADLEYGRLLDHHGVRLAGGPGGTAYVGLDARGQCEAMRILPALSRLTPSPALCSLDPDRLAGAAPAADELGALEKILAEAPRRVLGQPRGDLGLVAWAGDRAYFLAGGRLRSAARAGGQARDEPPPLAGKRARIAWGAFESDGEGVTFAGDAVVHVDAAGAIDRRAVDPGGPVRPALLGAPELASDRRRVARIGSTWWLARGDVIRVHPDLAAPPALRGLAPADASSLVGGADHGLLIEIAGEALRLTAIDAAGNALPLGGPPVVSPVRVGFDACARAHGGAIVAGASAADAGKIVTFAIDAEGHPSAPAPAPISIRPGELGVRLIALPGGGALLSDLDRRRAVWLDDDGRPIRDEAWPLQESVAACADGRPARRSIPSPSPGVFIDLPDFEAPGTCVSGDVAWTAQSLVRWFGSAVKGTSAVPEAGIVAVEAPLFTPAASSFTPDPSRSPARPPACPSDMVSVTGRYCIDRFEDTLADVATGEALSPDYPTTPNLLEFALGEWSTARERVGGVHARAFPLPWISPERLGKKIDPVAVSRFGARPNGYVTGLVAQAACAAAGKRLCSLDEFVTACRGEDDTAFPYGDTYEDGVCNVFREEHPAAILHANASVGHLDPRLNRVDSRGRPLLQRTAESPACRSRWGNDAAYDLAGNLDEWVAEGNGAFAGGFYSRSTRAGCDALVTAHPFSYLDYSTGVRCCRDASSPK